MPTLRGFGSVLFVSTAASLAAGPLAYPQEDYTILKGFTLSDLGPATELVRATDGNFYGGTPAAVYRRTPGQHRRPEHRALPGQEAARAVRSRARGTGR